MRSIIEVSFLSRNFLRQFANFSQRQVVQIPYEKTLTGRIFNYLNVDSSTNSSGDLSLVKKIMHDKKLLQMLNNRDLIQFSRALPNQLGMHNEIPLLLREIDNECYSRVSKLKTEDILNILNVYMNITPNNITEYKFFHLAVRKLYESLSNLDKKDFMQLLFYIGLQKKNPKSQEMLKECVTMMDHKFIYNLTTEELCIICNSTFKTSTLISNKKILEKVSHFINNNLDVLSDSSLFIILVKTLRHNKYQNDDLLNTISCTLFFNKALEHYGFSSSCHIMALYADYSFYDEQLFRVLTKKCLEELRHSKFISKKIHSSQQLRGKDIKRFLWVMALFSELKLLSHSDIKDVIIPHLLERIKCGGFEKDLESLVDITLYLWMLNYRAYEIVPYIFNKKAAMSLAAELKNKLLRLNLLLQVISIEDPDLSGKIVIKHQNVGHNIYSSQLRKRPVMQRVLKSLNVIREKLELKKIQLSQEIDNIKIVGITGFQSELKKVVFVEVLDDYTTLKNIEDDVPIGLMALKLRLLECTDQSVLVVSQREIEDMTNAELDEYLLDELKLIC